MLKTVPVWEADAFLIYGAAVLVVLTAVTATELSQMTTVKGLTPEGGTGKNCATQE